MPRFVVPILVVLGALALIPPVLVARARVATSRSPRLHFLLDMDQQPKFKTQQKNSAFADGRAMRPPVPGTVARGELEEDDHLYRGKVDGEWATTFPMPVTGERMRRGRERYGVFCAVCHGLSGDGRGPVAVIADDLQEGTWTIPTDITGKSVRDQPVGQIYNSIRNGVRNMPAYGPQIPTRDRWAIVAYIRALQRSAHARMEDVPPEYKERLR